MLTLLAAFHAAHLCRVLIAALALLEASYVCPVLPVHVRNPRLHLREYQGTLPRISSGRLAVAGLSNAAQRAGARLLAAALDTCFKASHLAISTDAERLEAMRQLQQAARQLERPEAQQQLSQAVAALSAGRPEGQPPFTLQQLLLACHDNAASAALGLCTPTAAFSGGGTVAASAILQALRQSPGAAEAAAAVRSTAAALWRLEPGNPRALDVGAQMLLDGYVAPQQSTMQQLLSGIRRAEASGSALWTIRLAGAVAMACVRLERAATPADMQDLQQMLQRAEAALEGNKRLLPHPWVNLAQASMPAYKKMLHASQITGAAAAAYPQLVGDLLAAFATADQQTQATMDALVNQMGQHTKTIVESHICNGCGKHAVGLRACARCCSRECQAAHWP